MHAPRERAIDRTFRLRCLDCGFSRFAELGGEKQETAEAGGNVEARCGRCGDAREHEVVAP